MLQKLKDFTAISEKIENIEQSTTTAAHQTAQLTTDITNVKSEIEKVKQSIDAITKKQQEFQHVFDNVVLDIKKTNTEFQRDLSDFKVIKGNVEHTLIQRLADEFRSALLEHVEKLNVDMKSYNDLKEQINTIVSRTEAVSSQVNKFIAISTHIKKEDFELNKVAKQLSDADHEKLRLLKRVDMLERLLSKERRKAYQQTV